LTAREQCFNEVNQIQVTFLKKDVPIMKIHCIMILFLYSATSLTFFQAPLNAAEISNDNILKFGIHVTAMGKLDPHCAAASQDRAFADMVFNGLLRYKPGNAPQIEPDLALAMPEFKLMGGKQIWTINLRSGIMFHAGPKTPAYELTADDVIFSLNKSKDKNFCAYAGGYAGMTLKKITPYLVQIILDKPISPTLFFPKIINYGGGFILSEKAVKTMGYDAFLQHPIGTGPFAFHRYDKKGLLLLKAHDQYFRGRPLLDEVQIHFIPDVKDRLELLKKGGLDVITGSGQKGWLELIKNEKNIVVDTHGVGEVATLYFNTRMKPMDDIRVRQAIAFSLSRQTFLNSISSKISGSVYSPVPDQFLPGGLSKEDVRTLNLEYFQDIDKARQLLKQAGYPNGFTLDIVSSEKWIYQTYYNALKKQLTKINIICNIKVKTHSNMHEQIRQHPQPIVIYPACRPNADAFLTRFFHSDSIVVTGKKPDTNFSCYDKIDKIIEAARLEIDPEAQSNLWAQAQIRILSDMVAYPILFTKQVYLRKNYVDYGHSLVSTMALYPQFTEKTNIRRIK
jgi:peptide/nickel transport system substrate-binding protein